MLVGTALQSLHSLLYLEVTAEPGTKFCNANIDFVVLKPIWQCDSNYLKYLFVRAGSIFFFQLQT